jgi:hypothetical protein
LLAAALELVRITTAEQFIPEEVQAVIFHRFRVNPAVEVLLLSLL